MKYPQYFLSVLIGRDFYYYSLMALLFLAKPKNVLGRERDLLSALGVSESLET